MTITITLSKAGAFIETRVDGKYKAVACESPKKTLAVFTKILSDLWNLLDSQK